MPSPHVPPLNIEHSPERGLFEVVVDGARCELTYTFNAGIMSINHTGVPPRVEGRGIAAALMAAALTHAQVSGWKVRPLCSYAHRYMQRHPETLSLTA